MTNILPQDANSVIYEGIRDAAGQQFVAKAAGTVATDAGGVKSAPQLVSSVDGAQATLGATSDIAYTGSGSSSVVAALKGVYAKIAATLSTKVVDAAGTNQLAVDASGRVGVNNFPATQPVSGTVGVSSLPALPTGANAIGSVSVSNFPATQAVSAASLPLPSGAAQEAGHLATIDTSTAAVNTATGAQTDVAYTTGNGSVIALLKGVFTKLAGTLAVSGTVTANAGANLNTASLALESGGNLAAAKADLDTLVTQTTGLVAGAKVALSTPPANLTAGADTALTFASQVRHLYIQNKSASDIYIEFDAPASLGSLILPGNANTLVQFDLPCTALHCYCAAAVAVNGSTSANLVVEGRA